MLLLAWAAGLTGLVVGHLWTGPESLTEKLIAFGGLSGVALVFLSVVIDRLKTLRTDPYRRVQK